MIIKDFKQKKEKLEQIRKELKEEFFGIDSCIDKILDSIKTWYYLPEILSRPVIINLWGMTGVGKTALVRSLVSKINFNHAFVEIQMDALSEHNEDYDNKSSIFSILKESSIEEGEPGIILLDEFQRYRTIDQEGKDLKVERYQDVWMLLSDGRFSTNYAYLKRIEERLYKYEYWEDYYKAEKQAGDKSLTPAVLVNAKRMFGVSFEDAATIKNITKTKKTVRELMLMSQKEMIEELSKILVDKNIPSSDFSKTLIFVSGNLDEAFTMSDAVEDCETSADIYHEYTKKIGATDIKKCLLNRFKPEQIARLGNTHVIYPSLPSDAYYKIIKRACNQYVEEINKKTNIKFSLRENIFKEIYENSVYPTQGTRPVFTSVSKIFGAPLSDGLFWAIENKLDQIEIDCDSKNSCLIFSAENHSIKVPIELELSEKRKKTSKDFNALVAVHEAGHAILHAILFNTAPSEIAINLASYTGGYTRYHYQHLSKKDIFNKIKVSFGGIIAEEIIFGGENRSDGCKSDIQKATEQASSLVRRLAMDDFNSYILDEQSQKYDTGVEKTNVCIQKILSSCKEEGKNILTKNQKILLKLSLLLLEKRKINEQESLEFFRQFFPDIESGTEKDTNVNYYELLQSINN